MTAFRPGRAWLAALPLAAICALPLTSSSAQSPTLAKAYGGGSLPTSLPKTDVQSFGKATAIALVPSGDSVRIRASLGLRCTGYRGGISSDDALLRAPLAANGTFSGRRKVRSREMGDLTVSVSGTITADTASGSLTTSSIRSPRQRCATSKRDWVAKPVDVGAGLPVEGNAGGGSLLVGLTSGKSTIPFGVVARMSADGTRVNRLFHSAIVRCRTEGRRARDAGYTYDVQYAREGYSLRNGRFSRTVTNRETKAERRKGIRFRGRHTISGRVSSAGMRAVIRDTGTYRETGYYERCAIPRTVLRMVPAG